MSLRVPINDGPEGRVGYLFFTQTDDGWRLSKNERGDHEAKTGVDEAEGSEALADTLVAYAEERIKRHAAMLALYDGPPQFRPGFRGDFKAKMKSVQNIKFSNSKRMLLLSCKQIGAKLLEFDWPTPSTRTLSDGTILDFNA